MTTLPQRVPLFLLLVFFSPSLAQSPDRSRLNRFFEVTNGHHLWRNNSHWNTTKPICSWFGVTCHEHSLTKDTGVIHLELPSNGIVGRIPHILYEMNMLKVLNLKDNSLTSAGLEGLNADTSKLEKLDLSQNGLTSLPGIGNAPPSLAEIHLDDNRVTSLPKEIFQLHKLKHVYLTKNNLKGTLSSEIHKMTSLVHFNVYDNELTGPLPSEIGLLQNLKLLSLAHNALTGTIPTTFNSMASLETLSLHNQRNGGFTGSLPHFDSNPNLKEVFLDENGLEGTIPHKFLQALDTSTDYVNVGLSFNHLTGTVPPELERFESLQINIVGNEITHLPMRLCKKKKWMAGAVQQYGCDAIACPNSTYNKNGRQEFDDDACMPCPGGTGSPYLGATTCYSNGGDSIIKILHEFYTALKGSEWKDRDGWEAFDDANAKTSDWSTIEPCTLFGVDCIFNSLHGIYLPNNGLVGTIPSSIFTLPDLAVFDVSRNAVTLSHKGLKAIEKGKLLTQLNIASTNTRKLEGIGLLKSILILNIGSLAIGGPIPTELFDLTGIHEIHARATNFTGTLPTLVGNLVDLERLDLFNNALTGTIPTEIGRLADVKLVDLAENDFSGKLPSEMASMTSLHKLHLHQVDGSLTGKLLAFDTMPKLAELLLDSNNFTGSIPENFVAGISNKTLPVSIDLSDNQLTGTVPSALEDFDRLSILLKGNMISDIAPELCAKGEWMDGDVNDLGSCDAILCPNGTWNAYGRASNQLDAVCAPCPTNPYFGSTTCGDDTDPYPEKKILDDLYKKTGGKHWTSKANWTDSTVGICFREGVTCANASDINSGVTEVHLVGINMLGRIPSSIFKLPSIEVLEFSDNQVDIPLEHIDKAKKLRALRMSTTDIKSVAGVHKAHSTLDELQLSSNKLSGTIPSDLMKLSNVKRLYLSNNYFNETIPSSVTSLSSIEVLDLSQNDITGHLPTELGFLTTLEVLNLSENVMSGVIATELGLLKNLKALSLALQRKLSGPLLPFDTNPSLHFLDLAHNDIQGTIPSNFLTAVSASETIQVDLTSNKITGSLPDTLDRLQFLDIDLSGNKIDALADKFCDEGNSAWMGGKVGELGTCDAILCPPGSAASNGLGRQIGSDSPCEPCPGGEEEAPYFGATACSLTTVELEREALASFYELANGPSWSRQTNWNSEKSVCTWYGVSCIDDDIVVSLELQHNNIESGSDVKGLASDLLFSLKNLVTLDLRGNNVPLNFESLPEDSSIQKLKLSSTRLQSLNGISEARKLRELVVSDNYLTGGIPDELYTMSQLEAVYLSFNWLSGTLSTRIGQLSKLAHFYVDGNDLSGVIPSEIGLLTNLKNLVVSDNVFSGSIPSEVGSLPKLQLFSAYRIKKPGPRFSGSLPSFDNVPSLSTLYLDHNDLTGTIPSKFLSASPLASFAFLGYNFLSGSAPVGLDSIPSIYLGLEGNRISGIPKQFCNKTEWMGGVVGRIGCDAIVCPPGKSSPTGRANDTVSCEVCSSSDAAKYYGSTSCDEVWSEKKILLRLYQRCGGIEWYRKDNWASDEHVCEWFGVSCHDDRSVKSIDLPANNLVNEPPFEIFFLPRLESLYLSSNPINFNFVGIGKARRLTELRLDSIGLSSLEGLEEGVGLTHLSLRFNSLQGSFPQEVLALTNLRELNLADNRLESQLPAFSDLTRLQTLRLGSNGFTGSLPSFNDMVVLTTIDLSYNRLSGTIPIDFLLRLPTTAKVHLDLASNLLTGNLPYQLSRFDVMTIYLRDNRISDIDSVFCKKKEWNGGDVKHFGCNALLCPPGTATAIGRQSMARIEAPCKRCENRNMAHYGMISCEESTSSASTRALGLVATTCMSMAIASCLMML